MPQRLLLEGPDLEALMLRAREDYGPAAVIVSAEKVRSGGFMGFFTREHFELTIEVADAVLAALDAMGRHPSRHGKAPGAGGRSTAEAALAAEIADAEAAREAMLADAVAGPGADSFAAMRPMSGSASPVDSTDMAEFDRLVLQLTAAATPESDEALGDDAAPASTPPPAAPAAFRPASFPVATPGVVIGKDDPPGAPSDDRELVSSSPPGRSARHGASAAGPESAALASAQAAPSPEPSGIAAAEGGVLHRWGVFSDVASAVSTHCTVPALLALGVPLRSVAAFADLLSPVPLLDVVATFSIPPVRRPEPGDLVVIAGPAEDAVAVATQVAAWMGMPATAVVLAGEAPAIRGHGRRLRTEAEARTARRKADAAAALGEPLIVALGVGPGRRGAAAASPLLASFEADTAWAVVDATKRAAVHEPALRLLAGKGRIDGLAAIGLADAQAPAAIVESAIPVAWMDGLPAASVVWAALLGERIALGD